MKYFIWFASIISFLVIVGLWIIYKLFNPSELGIEIGKALLQIGIIAIFGQIATIAGSNINRQYQSTAALKEYRKSVLEKINRIYSSVKKNRRLIRAKALIIQNSNENIEAVIDCEKYDKFLQEINEKQLSLEVLGKEIVALKKSFFHSEIIVCKIKRMESYLNEIIREYQKMMPIIIMEQQVPMHRLEKLSDLIGNYDQSKFKTEFVENYTKVLKLLQSDILLIKV